MKDKYKELYVTQNTDEKALKRLIDIVKVLREECPWDKVQTHQTLTTCMLEESYEVVDAINNNDVPNLREELGDVLLQVVFHGILSEEENDFTISDLINEECEKMIRRHPHIFLDENVKSVDKVLEKWENIKGKEHGEETATERLQRVPKALPALMRSYKIQKKAAQVGFDWETPEEVFPKVREEFLELKEAYESKDTESMDEELGDLLFTVVNVARHLGINPEESLTKSTDKFVERFSKVEELSKDSGLDIKDMSPEELDQLWNKAKNK